MQIAVGTFNLNNPFSHFNFRGEVTAMPEQPPIEFTTALVSKPPLGQATSWQHARHKSEPTSLPIFSRDLLEVDVLAPGRTKRLFTVYVNHLKSKYTEAKSSPARELELKEAAERRSMQAETLIEIVERKQRPKGRHIVLGDMNDTPTSKPLTRNGTDHDPAWVALDL